MGKPELLPSETLQATISKEELIRQLSAILAPDALLHQREELRPFECDGLTAYQRLPLLVVLPENEDQVRAILRICHAGRVPVVFRGAGTGLSGGALPYEHGVLLVMSLHGSSPYDNQILSAFTKRVEIVKTKQLNIILHNGHKSKRISLPEKELYIASG